jgi:hypothetical protein
VIFFTFEGLPRCHYSPQLSGESHAHNQAFGGCRRPARIRGFWHLRVGTFGPVSRAADRPSLVTPRRRILIKRSVVSSPDCRTEHLAVPVALAQQPVRIDVPIDVRFWVISGPRMLNASLSACDPKRT